MKRIRFIGWLILMGLLLAACTAPPASGPVQTETASPAGPVETPQLAPAETLIPEETGTPPAIAAAQQALADQLNLEVSAVEVHAYAPAEWPDSCLGLPEAGEACAEVVTPGYGGRLSAQGRAYEFRTDEPGTGVRFVPGAALSARQVLAQQLGVDLASVRIGQVEATHWPDACLGVRLEGLMCAQVVTPGYRVALETQAGRFEFHTDETGGEVRLASAPAPRIGASLIRWQGEDGFCQTLEVGQQGLAFGLCGGPQMQGGYALEQRAEDLDFFVETFAPFEADTPAGKLSFNGQGDRPAAPAEQRMIAEWARQVFIEALSGWSGASYGLALAWRREGGIAGFCDDLEVYLSGTAYATTCKGNEPNDVGHTRLSLSQLEQLYAWVDRLQPFEVENTDPAAADAMTVRLVFSGTGQLAATPAEKDAIQAFAAELYGSLLAAVQPAGPAADLGAARQALLDYFTALNEGDYADAAGVYGGSYEVLTGYNPDLPADDHAGLLEAGCRFNGLQCLAVKEILTAEAASPDEFRFRVSFANPDGSLFERGPCCGADPAQTPPESEFLYTVRKGGASFLVQELPPYLP